MNKVYTVSEVNSYIKRLFDDDYVMESIRIEGEVSNYKRHSSGHLYFTLKDDASALSAVMFAGKAATVKFEIKNGMRLEAVGKISVYERDGKYQIYVNELIQSGYGKLYMEYERLKKELLELGMFDRGYKKPIPNYATRVGVVTSPTGAAIQDIIRVSKMRNPYVHLYLCPALVQGEGAAKSIANALAVLDEMNLDVLIVGRGGGSIEDLWAFNERIVAQAIFACKTPIISAVGHETDFTIADFVADTREATPSSAAARAVFDYSVFSDLLKTASTRMNHTVRLKMEQVKLKLSSVKERLNRLGPLVKLDNHRIYLDSCLERLNDLMLQNMEKKHKELEKVSERLNDRITGRLSLIKHELDLKRNSLKLLSPYEKLSRGYSFVSDSEGNPISSVEKVSAGTLLQIEFADGGIETEVKKITWKK